MPNDFECKDFECTEYLCDQHGMVRECEYDTSGKWGLKRHLKAVHDRIEDALWWLRVCHELFVIVDDLEDA